MLTTEQLKARKRGIGGSDAAAVCGVSKWRTPVDVYLDKTSPEVHQVTSPAMERGHVLEPLVRALFEQQTGKTVKIQKNTLTHDRYQFMLANIDGYLPDEKALFEAKTASYHTRGSWGDAMSDQIPDDYFCQVQHYMAVTNTLVTYVAVLMGDACALETLSAFVKLNGTHAVLEQGLDLDFRIYLVKRDDPFIERMTKIEGDFWVNNVTMGITPDTTGCDDLRTLFPSAQQGKSKVATEEAMTLLALRQGVKEQANAFDLQVKELDARLMAFMEDAEALVDFQGTRLVSWKNTARTMLDTLKLKQDLPEMYHQFSKTITSRTFRI